MANRGCPQSTVNQLQQCMQNSQDPHLAIWWGVQRYACHMSIMASQIDCLFKSLFRLTHIDGLVQERRNFIALAMELHLSCTKPSIYSEYQTSPLAIYDVNALKIGGFPSQRASNVESIFKSSHHVVWPYQCAGWQGLLLLTMQSLCIVLQRTESQQTGSESQCECTTNRYEYTMMR